MKYILLFICFSVNVFAQQTLTYQYDNLGRLTEVHYFDGTILYYTFDALGNRTTKAVAGNSRMRDSLALVAFYNAADGDNWHNTLDNNQKWLEGSMDTWYGVTMTEGGCRVESIFLRNDALNGTISPKIGDLDSLKTLTLSFNNQLSGSLPLELSNLKNLEEINFTRSNLSGAIDPIFDLESLRILHISDNEFNGTIDGLIDNTNLERLFIGGNNFTGTLEVVSNLLKLRSLSASYNNFDGEIPTGIVNLVDLESLDLNSTFLGGEIPSDIGNLTKLTSLNLHQAALTGSVPNSISNLTQLEFLYLEINYLNGNIDFLSDLTALKQVRLDNNNFSGSIPEDIDNLSSLTYIDLQINENIVGAFPSSLCNITTLEKAYFGRTQISGSLLDCITNLPNLESLSVQNTLMSGTVPNFSSTPNLEFLDLAVCHFTFEGIEENVNYFNNSPTFNYFDYSFQANIPLFQTGSGEFYVDAGGTLANNTYKWYKDNDISPIFTSTGNNTYTPTNSGTYYCKITNSICTGLELRTEDIDFEDCDIVFVSYSSGNFPDVVNAQEFIEIQNATIQSGQNKELRAGNYILFDTGTIIEDGSTVTSEIAACSTTSASKSSSNSEEAHSQVSLTSYPNPFSDKLTVEYTLPTESEVSLQIVDISGKLQKTLVTQQTQEKGVYTIKWNSCKLPIGVYHCILDVNGERYSYRLVKN